MTCRACAVVRLAVLTLALEDAQDLGASHALNLGNAVAVAQQHANLRGGHALLGQLANHLAHLQASKQQVKGRPCARSAGEPGEQNWSGATTLNCSASRPPRTSVVETFSQEGELRL
jgi:hypothetical protein